MNKEEVAARLLILEQRCHDLTSEIHLLFQDVLDSIKEDAVE